MADIPKIKKKINAFLTREEGKISKENLIKAGILLSAAAIASLKRADAVCPVDASGSHGDHCNAVYLDSHSRAGADGHHSNAHSSHGSHGSHGSHTSHGSHGSW